uniref:Glycosyltransferase family 92 protein n=1 Tax=Corethron hystrix TaxID=216773 RepID=A0A6U5LT45_9STRA
MAACLLVKDDNDRLPEWIAYHYQVLPLRKLIIAVDPTSNESPGDVLERWKLFDLQLDFETWSEEDFIPDSDTLQNKMNRISVRKLKEKANLGKNDEVTAEQIDMFRRHIVRQKEFICQCLHSLKRSGWGWTLLVDSDEYLLFNSVDRGNLERKYPLTGKTVGNEYNNPERLKQINEMRLKLPQTGKTTVMDYIDEQNGSVPWIDEPCMPLPRIFFGALESPESVTSDAVPQGFDVNSLSTLRYRKHSEKGAFKHNFYDKSLVDVSRISHMALDNITLYNAHRPLKECYDVRPFDDTLAIRKWEVEGKIFSNITPLWRSLLRVNHYLGPWKSYSRRKDPRRNLKLYNDLGNVDYGSDDEIVPWFSSFIENVGLEVAKKLLELPDTSNDDDD